MNVLSLFDGISCGQVALNRAGIRYDRYYASEIKPQAIETAQKHYPATIQMGDVRKVLAAPDISLLIGGSPCKGISRLNKNQDGLQHKESILFWEFIRIKKEIEIYNPGLQWLLENTPGKKESTNSITKTLGIRPIRLNSALVSAQNRSRLYWTNIPVNSLPSDKRLTTTHILESELDERLIATEGRVKWLHNESGKKSVRKGRINPYPKSGCLTANGHRKWNCNYIFKDGKYRYLSIAELEELQTLPPGYCSHLSYGDAYDVIGDGRTIDIIAHIFKHLK